MAASIPSGMSDRIFISYRRVPGVNYVGNAPAYLIVAGHAGMRIHAACGHPVSPADN
jgi:hypothetical protein